AASPPASRPRPPPAPSRDCRRPRHACGSGGGSTQREALGPLRPSTPAQPPPARANLESVGRARIENGHPSSDLERSHGMARAWRLPWVICSLSLVALTLAGCPRRPELAPGTVGGAAPGAPGAAAGAAPGAPGATGGGPSVAQPSPGGPAPGAQPGGPA